MSKYSTMFQNKITDQRQLQDLNHKMSSSSLVIAQNMTEYDTSEVDRKECTFF